jgi:hypothetical protein
LERVSNPLKQQQRQVPRRWGGDRDPASPRRACASLFAISIVENRLPDPRLQDARAPDVSGLTILLLIILGRFLERIGMLLPLGN